MADIDITESDTNLADIHISFETRDHGDGYAFDGRGQSPSPSNLFCFNFTNIMISHLVTLLTSWKFC